LSQYIEHAHWGGLDGCLSVWRTSSCVSCYYYDCHIYVYFVLDAIVVPFTILNPPDPYVELAVFCLVLRVVTHSNKLTYVARRLNYSLNRLAYSGVVKSQQFACVADINDVVVVDVIHRLLM